MNLQAGKNTGCKYYLPRSINSMLIYGQPEHNVPLSMKYHTPRTTTAAIAMIFIEERPVITRAASFTLYTFTRVSTTAVRNNILSVTD